MIALSGVPAFVHVAEQKSFRAAAHLLGCTPTAVSKAVSRLEARLGAKLLHRTSRHVSLTPEGEVYLSHCRAALNRLQAGEDAVTAITEVAEGTVGVSLSTVMGRPFVASLDRLVSRHPRIAVSLFFTDREVSLVEEQVDIAVRIGELPDSSLVGRSLRRPRWVTAASPLYLSRSAPLRDWRDLEGHTCLNFARPVGKVGVWEYHDGDDEVVLRPNSGILMDDGALLVEAACSGVGVVRALDFMVEDRIQAGELVEVLSHQATTGPPMRALTLPGRARVPKIAAVLSFIDELFGRRPET
jgi:DNA-binding transcriptional LysR family regulator